MSYLVLLDVLHLVLLVSGTHTGDLVASYTPTTFYILVFVHVWYAWRSEVYSLDSWKPLEWAHYLAGNGAIEPVNGRPLTRPHCGCST